MSALGSLSRDLSLLVSRAAPAVVGLAHRRGHGSGLALTGDGYVLTNSHVARGAGPLRVRVGAGRELPARLVGADDATDLAVVRVDERLPAPLTLADRRGVQVGELVVAIGNPLGFDRSVSLGIVSAVHRTLPTGPTSILEGLIQTDAAVNPGNSGGPLLDAEGRVVGITTAMVAYARGIGFAVPASTASWVAAVLIQRGEVVRPRLGITARSEELPFEAASGRGQSRGVRVLGVEDGAPASGSGLRAGDLLLAANGRPLLSLDDLQRVMVLAEGGEVTLVVDRAGETRSVAVLPAARPRAA